VLGLLLGVADFDVDAEVQGRAEGQEEGEGHGDCGADLWRNVVGFLVTLCVTLTLEVAVAVVSMRGSILNVHPRSAIPYLLYIRLGRSSPSFRIISEDIPLVRLPPPPEKTP